ncbi:MAG: hypothetical protein ACREIF_16775, partial [Chthoniobacterales bacterium]
PLAHATVFSMSLFPQKRTFHPGGFNQSAQHLLIYGDEEVEHGDVTDLVHVAAEVRVVGALEERTKRSDYFSGA